MSITENIQTLPEDFRSRYGQIGSNAEIEHENRSQYDSHLILELYPSIVYDIETPDWALLIHNLPEENCN
jgi:hypothetical protein